MGIAKLARRRTLLNRKVHLRARTLSTDVIQAAAASDMLNVMRRTTTPMSTNPSFMKLLFSEDIRHLNGKVEGKNSRLVCDFCGVGH